MIEVRVGLIALASSTLVASSLLTAQHSAPQNPPDRGGLPGPPGRGRGGPLSFLVPSVALSFFVTSVGRGDGGDLGGLAGADAHCQKLATAVGRGGVTWHAYLSTQGTNAVNARDRIGNGPWFNANGEQVAKDVGDLHGDTLELARIGNAIHRRSAVNEKGEQIPENPLVHDMLTGTQPDGRTYTDGMDHTCNNWTSDSNGSAQLGHHDRTGLANTSWNSSHASRGCNEMDLAATGGAGLFYCFAVN